MAITIRQVGKNVDYHRVDNPIDCLIQSTEVSQPDFKLRTRVLVDGAVKADLRIPALGTQYFRFDIAPIVRDYAKFDLIDTLSGAACPEFKIVCSELFTSGGVTVEQGTVTGDAHTAINAGQNWEQYVNNSLSGDEFKMQSNIIYTNFQWAVVSIFYGETSGDAYQVTDNGDAAFLAQWTGAESKIKARTVVFEASLLSTNTLSFTVNGSELNGISIQRKSPCTRFGRYGLTWLNPLGGYEPLMLCRFAETITDTSERSYYTTQKGKRQGNSIVFDMYNKGRANAARVTTDRNMKLITDFLTTEEMDNFISIMQSPDVYLYDDELARNGASFEQSIMPVRIQQGSMEKKYSEKDGLFFAELEIQLDDRIVRHGS